VLIPILYLKGISTGDFEEALAALLGKDAGGLSASTIARRARFAAIRQSDRVYGRDRRGTGTKLSLQQKLLLHAINRGVDF